MPPKKKRKSALPEQNGVAHRYLSDNFATLSDRGEVKKGHILYQFSQNERSVPNTCKAVKDVLRWGILIPHQLRTLVDRTLKKYKKFSRDQDLMRFAEICHEKFEFSTTSVASTEEVDLAHESAHLDSGLILTANSTPVVQYPIPNETETVCQTPCSSKSHSSSTSIRSSTRNQYDTPRKIKLKKRLDYLTKTKVDLKNKFDGKVKGLQAKLSVTKGKRVVNQNLKRKEEKIKTLKKQMNETELGKKLAAAEVELSKLKRKQRRHEKRTEADKLKRKQSQYEKRTKADKLLLVDPESEEIIKLKAKVQEKNAAITNLQNEKLLLEESIDILQDNETSMLKKEGKTYSTETRMFVYDGIVNNVPTKSVPVMIEQFARRAGLKLDCIPHRSTVEMMARELGVISDFLVGEFLMRNSSLTLGFDATTQEGVHINSIHVTSQDTCYVVSVDQLAGGTAEDYEQHICESLERVCAVYSPLAEQDYAECRSQIISNISNTMTDRAAVNHATIVRLEDTWGKSLNELNCHLHPLDTIASSLRSALKAKEPDPGKIYGKDCLAANIVLQLNKMRYVDGKGDPRGFVLFLDEEQLQRGILPRYRGNRLHILFHICGVLTKHYDQFLHFLQDNVVSCGGLKAAVLADFATATGRVEMQVLGLIGKLLSGPWMKRFYTSAEHQVNHLEGFNTIKAVVSAVERYKVQPMSTLTTNTDFFGDKLAQDDTTVHKLQEAPEDETLFRTMMEACLTSVIAVVQRQYKRYYELDVTEEILKETESARDHNIDAEEVMGMFSAAQEHAPNATLCYLSCKIRAKKNKVVEYLDSQESARRQKIINMAITSGRKQRQNKRKRCVDVRKELAKRLALKREKKQTMERQKIEKRFKAGKVDVPKEFPDLDEGSREDLQAILAGQIIGKRLCHVWYDRKKQTQSIYNGKVEKIKRKAGGTYIIGYWEQDQTYEKDAVDYDVSKYELAADFVCEDLTLL